MMRFTLTERIIGTTLQWIWYYLFYVQPGVDREAVLRWVFMNPLWGNHRWLGGLLIFVIGFATDILVITLYYSMYYLQIPFIERYRVLGPARLGFTDPNPNRRQSYIEMNKQAFIWYLQGKGRIFSTVIPGLLILHFIDFFNPTRIELILSRTPDRWTTIWHLTAGAIVFETIFYWGHRWLHLPQYYKYHKLHHQYRTPNALTGHYIGTLDIGLTALLPLAIIPWLFRMHWWTVMMWFVIHITHSSYDHSGYEFPFCPWQLIPFSGYVAAHDFHHSNRTGNFGLYWRWWDRIGGTDVAWNEYCGRVKVLDSAIKFNHKIVHPTTTTSTPTSTSTPSDTTSNTNLKPTTSDPDGLILSTAASAYVDEEERDFALSKSATSTTNTTTTTTTNTHNIATATASMDNSSKTE